MTSNDIVREQRSVPSDPNGAPKPLPPAGPSPLASGHLVGTDRHRAGRRRGGDRWTRCQAPRHHDQGRCYDSPKPIKDAY